MTSTDSVRATTVVAVEPEVAFTVFTDEIDLWWRRGPRFRWRPERPGTLRFEGEAGGRLVEVTDDATGEGFEVGRILAWKPGERLVFEFRALSFEPGQCTEVEVRFEAVSSGTRVSVEHRGWDSLPADHPARHGLSGPAFADMMGAWWADLLVAARRQASRKPR
jgi:uncharacterized protein YndB with AHSA1/START domain